MPDRVLVNVANPHELLRLPGVGPEQAERIVKFRTEHGPIGNESELSRVLGWRGLGESMWGRVDFSAGDRGRAGAASYASPDLYAPRSGRDASRPSPIRDRWSE
jgi:hypothetical protein